ncbi:MFS transporter [Nioella nitratireducens]|uniref:MFS transporter n=1 Tax=Nioella nitratireducens TaxID=1287720 RepID=UPI0008FD246D|nr:MFS transporter [Nioella nitratireducens]
MLSILRHPVFIRLFAAQGVALVGTGLLTVALALLAYDLAGDRAGTVLGTALTIKMVAYVGLSPLAAALFSHLPRKAVLVGADLIRAAVALALPFIDAIWQVYVLIFVLQAASASFTPAFQALIPDVLPKERDYTNALSLSRLAYDLENLLSPTLAGLLLMVMSYNTLFVGTVVGFLGSALLILSAPLPPRATTRQRRFRDRLTRGVQIYLATPRLRGLLALNMAVSSVIAFVLVDTVVLVRGPFGGDEGDVALAMAAFGLGSMAVAIGLPRLLDRTGDRPVMLAGGTGLTVLGLATAAGLWAQVVGWSGMLALWAGFGAVNAAVMTPSGRLLKRSAHEEDRAALFTAQFALSHACWLLAYPAAGWFGPWLGLAGTLSVLGLTAGAATLAARHLWPRDSAAPLPHTHPDLPADHPHLRAHGLGRDHAHPVVIDDDHRHWPVAG